MPLDSCRRSNIFSSDGTKAVTISKDCLKQYKSVVTPVSYNTVAPYTRRLRSSQGLPLRQRLVRQPLPKVTQPEKRPLTARRAAMLVLQRQELHKSDNEQLMARLQVQHPALFTAIELAQSFAQMVRQHLPDQLDSWFEQAILAVFHLLSVLPNAYVKIMMRSKRV
jgi:transposase